MKSKKFLTLLAVSAICLTSGCTTPSGKVHFPQASANFVPQASYPVSTDLLWNSVLASLEKNRIPVLSQDKSSGVIQTDYLEGQGTKTGGFLVTQSTRYKYNITVRPQSENQSKLVILAKVESTVSNGQGATPWTDVSGQNETVLKTVENWLYEQIQKELPTTGPAK